MPIFCAGGEGSDVLLYTNTTTVEFPECWMRFPHPDDIQAGMMCVGKFGENTKASCDASTHSRLLLE